MPWLAPYLNNDVANPYMNAIRFFMYQIVCALGHALDMLNGTINAILGTNISNIPVVQDLYNKMMPLSWAVLSVAMGAVAISLIFFGNKHRELFQHILLGVLLMISVPFIFTALDSFLSSGIADTQNLTGVTANIGQSYLQSNVIDIGGSRGSLQTLGASTAMQDPLSAALDHSSFHIDGQTINPYYLDINAILQEPSIFPYKVEAVSGDGSASNPYKMYGESLGTGLFGWGSEQLYAYSFNFWYLLITMLVMLVALSLAGFKLARTMFDIAFHHVLAPVVFASDISNSSRSKKFLMSLVSLYIMMILVVIVFKLFVDVNTWINANVSNLGVRFFLMAGAAWGCIDGPDIVARMLGVDVGTQNAAQTAMAAMMGLNTASGIARTVGGAFRTAGSAIGGATAIPGLKKAFAAGTAAKASGDFATTAEYASSLPRGGSGILGGATNAANAAKTFGFMSSRKPDTSGTDNAQKKAAAESDVKDNGKTAAVASAFAEKASGETSEDPQTHPDASSLQNAFTAANNDQTPPPEDVTGANVETEVLEDAGYPPAPAFAPEEPTVNVDPAPAAGEPSINDIPMSEVPVDTTAGIAPPPTSGVAPANISPSGSPSSASNVSSSFAAATSSPSIPVTPLEPDRVYRTENAVSPSPSSTTIPESPAAAPQQWTELHTPPADTSASQSPPVPIYNDPPHENRQPQQQSPVSSPDNDISHGWEQATDSIEKKRPKRTFWPKKGEDD